VHLEIQVLFNLGRSLPVRPYHTNKNPSQTTRDQATKLVAVLSGDLAIINLIANLDHAVSLSRSIQTYHGINELW
jgi:hypothetical protein